MQACFKGGNVPVKTRNEEVRLFSIEPSWLSLDPMVRQNGRIPVNSQIRTFADPCRRTDETLLLDRAAELRTGIVGAIEKAHTIGRWSRSRSWHDNAAAAAAIATDDREPWSARAQHQLEPAVGVARLIRGREIAGTDPAIRPRALNVAPPVRAALGHVADFAGRHGVDYGIA